MKRRTFLGFVLGAIAAPKIGWSKLFHGEKPLPKDVAPAVKWGKVAYRPQYLVLGDNWFHLKSGRTFHVTDTIGLRDIHGVKHFSLVTGTWYNHICKPIHNYQMSYDWVLNNCVLVGNSFAGSNVYASMERKSIHE